MKKGEYALEKVKAVTIIKWRSTRQIKTTGAGNAAVGGLPEN